MSTHDPRLDHFSREVIEKQPTSTVDWQIEEDTEMETAEEIVKLKNRRQAQREFGLNLYQLAMAVKRKELRRVQMEGGGRVYYLEDELRELAARLGGRRGNANEDSWSSLPGAA